MSAGGTDPTIDLIEPFGSTYVDSRSPPVADISTSYELMDLVLETTGHPRHAFETIDALGANQVGVLLGIPNDTSFTIHSGRLHRTHVLENKASGGSINSHVQQFDAAVATLEGFPRWFLDRVIPDVLNPAEIAGGLEGNDETKPQVEFSTV